MPAVAEPIVGAPGTVGAGTTGLEASEKPPVPMPLMARTRNRYDVPFANPATVCNVATELKVVDARAKNPTYGVTTYPVIGEPPSDAGAVHVTVA